MEQLINKNIDFKKIEKIAVFFFAASELLLDQILL